MRHPCHPVSRVSQPAQPIQLLHDPTESLLPHQLSMYSCVPVSSPSDPAAQQEVPSDSQTPQVSPDDLTKGVEVIYPIYVAKVLLSVQGASQA